VTRAQAARTALWTAVSLPAVYQLGLLITAIAARIGYPYDLEWTEGAILHHVLRIKAGGGLYVPPSIEFIPSLYTPLYPAVVAMFSGLFGLSYAFARAISVISLIGISVVAAVQIGSRRHEHTDLAPVSAGIVLGLGLFAASYPAADGWYDLASPDTMFLFMATSGLAGLPRWSLAGSGVLGHARIAAAGVLLALAVFCKQIGVAYAGLGALIVAFYAWRRLPAYLAGVGAVGVGLTALLQQTTDGWFWIYTQELRSAYDVSVDRFWTALAHIAWRPELRGAQLAPIGAAISIVVGGTLLVLAVTWWRHRRWPPQARPFALWTVTYLVSAVACAADAASELAQPNAIVPALLHGALAAGAAVPALFACVQMLTERSPHGEHVATGAALAAAGVLAYACASAAWQPLTFSPTAEDVAAGDRLIARIKQTEGEVWMPSHPWYLHLAGRTPYAHRAGIRDVTRGGAHTIEGLEQALRRHAFGAIFLDEPDLHEREVPGLLRYYRPVFKLPRPGQCPPPCRDADGAVCEPCAAPTCAPPPCNERPRLYSGERIQPESIWMPAVPATPPAGARVIFNFESETWQGWTASGAAWGQGPVTAPVSGQEMVIGATGVRFATSMHGGDAATGRLTSPEFAIDGARLTLRLGGGTDAKLRVELLAVDPQVNPNGTPSPVATASPLLPGGDTLREVTLDVSRFRGKPARLVLVDDSGAGHLVIDDVWLWR